MAALLPLLLACAADPATLTASTATLDLGTVAAGELATGELLLTHDGGGTVRVEALALSDPDTWSVGLLDPTLDPGQEEVLVVGFASQTTGAHRGTLTLTPSEGPALRVAMVAQAEAAVEPPEPVGGPDAFTYDRTVVHDLAFALDSEAIDALRAEPTAWVSGTLTWQDQIWQDVAFRLKGSASFQTIDEKPAWKVKFGEYVPGRTFHGLERLTLNNEVWDATMMAETMAYWTWREQGNPAPRTGYASVTLNGELLGLYAVLESMDDDFMDHTWPGSNGGLYEMTRSCDFTGDCTCFELQETGSAFDPSGITRGCEAVAVGTAEALAEAFDWEALVTYLALELSVSHPDSYSFNLNNFFVYHDPLTDRLFLSPWGADSTWTYVYPPSAASADCANTYGDTLTWSAAGWLMRFCQSDSTCRTDLVAKVEEIADWMARADVVGEMEATRELLDPHAELETHTNWTVDDRERWLACTLAWTEDRPETLRAWAERP